MYFYTFPFSYPLILNEGKCMFCCYQEIATGVQIKYFMFSTMHLGTNYLGHVQSTRKIVQILVCFSESLNFNIIFIIFLGMWLSTTHSIIVKRSMMCMLCKKEFASFFYLFVGCHWRSILLNSSRQLTFTVSTCCFLHTKIGCYIHNGIG